MASYSDHENPYSITMKRKDIEKSLKTDTVALAFSKGRRVGQPGHDRAIEYLEQRMTELELSYFSGESFHITYEATLQQSKAPHTFTNLIGLIEGTNRSLPPLLIGAHYDSVIDAPCVDDNATSVALNLAIADFFKRRPLERDIIIAFFDAEEPPYFLTEKMGSTRFYEDHCSEIDFAGVIITDLIGHDFCLDDYLGEVPRMLKPITSGLDRTVFLLGAESDAAFQAIIQSLSSKHKKLKLFPVLNSYIGNMSDHHAFEQAGQPFLFLSCGQGKFYHHKLDNLDWINFEKLSRITVFVKDVMLGLDKNPAGKALYQRDSFEFESSMIQKAMGKAKLSLTLKALGKSIPVNRAEMDELMNVAIRGII